MLQNINRKDLVLVGGGVVLILVILVIFFTQYWHKSGALPYGYQATIASNDLPLAPASTFTNSSGTLAPITVLGQGTATVYDMAADAGHGYYIIGTASQHRVNLYRQDLKNTKAGLEELTHSDTLKFDLSYDALSGVAAYMSVAKDGSKHVMVWSPVSKKETDLGEGLHPALLPGGFFVVFAKGGKLVSVNVQTKATNELLTLTPKTVFAVDAKSMKVALSVSAPMLIQQFSIANSVSASFLSSNPVSTLPDEMVFADGKLVQASLDKKSGALTILGGDGAVKTNLSGSIPQHYKLSIHHD